MARLRDHGIKHARELERLVSVAPRDTRRRLQRVADGNLGRVQAPAMEALGDRVSLDLRRLTGAIALASLVVGGSMLELVPMNGWREALGVTMIFTGLLGLVVSSLRALIRRFSRR